MRKTKEMAVTRTDMILAEIDRYFDENPHKISVTAIGIELHVEVQYEDFKTERQVRKDIEGFNPNIVVDEIRRDFSDTAKLQTLDNLYEPEFDCNIYIEDNDETLVKSTLCDYITDVMRATDFTQELGLEEEDEE